MELRHLRYFVAVAKAQNITHAAMQLNVSQPPVSRQIKDLEDELGVELFERKNKSVKLTDAGQIFLQDAIRLLAQADEAVKRVQALGRSSVREVRVAYPPSPSAKLLPLALSLFNQREPGARVALSDASSQEMASALVDRRVDVAIMVDAVAKHTAGLHFEPLLEVPVGLLVPASHPFAKRNSCTRNEVMELPLVGYSPAEYPEYLEWVRHCLGLSRPPKLVEECDGVSSLIAALKSGQAACVNSLMIAEISEKKLRFVPLDPPAVPLMLGVARLRKTLSPLAQTFWDCVVDAAAQLTSTAPASKPSPRSAAKKSSSAGTRTKGKPKR